MPKQLTLIFNHFETEHLGKDVFLVPYTIGKKYGYNVTIVYPLTPTNANFPDYIKGVKLKPIKPNKRLKWFPFWRTLPFYMYLLSNARKIDFLIRFHHQDHTYYHALLYKWINKKGILYLKCDGFPKSLRKAVGHYSHLSWLRKRMYKMLIKKIDRISVETSQDYKYIIGCGQRELIEKLRLLPNGFDESELDELEIEEKDFTHKDNLMITVGRLGTPQKNTELILRALDGINMKNWKMELIGPIENSLKPAIDRFFINNPDKKNNVVFTGPIYDKSELWSHYNRAKVFILSSNWENYALVLGEARRFRNYIISTNVGAAGDVTEDGKYGTLVGINDTEGMRKAIMNVINGNVDLDVYKDVDITDMSWDKLIDRLELDQIIRK